VRSNPIHLTPKEFDLLVYFIQHSGKVLTHRTAARSDLGRKLHRAKRISARVRRRAA
jgi:DNA-binding response OmpR family regulator